MTPSQGEVTQADRDAAAAFYGAHLALPGEVPVAAHMRAGKIDESPLIRAFAHHRARFEEQTRTATEREVVERCAAVAENLRIGGGTLSSWVNANEGPMGATRRHIAAAIRALSEQKS